VLTVTVAHYVTVATALVAKLLLQYTEWSKSENTSLFGFNFVKYIQLYSPAAQVVKTRQQ